MVNIRDLIDDSKCFQAVRELRWPDPVTCPHCSSGAIIKDGRDDTQPDRQRYLCRGCRKRFDDLTGTIFAGHHQPSRTWVLCLDSMGLNLSSYLCRGCRKRFDDLTGTIFAGHHQPSRTWILCLDSMGLNLSSMQIAKESDMNRSDVQAMVQLLRRGVVDRRPAVVLEGEVECDEVHVVAGHKEDPEAVKKKGRPGRRRRLKGERGRGTPAKEKPPVFGMIQRGGEVVIRILPDVKQATIEPLIRPTIADGSVVYTGEYAIDSRLSEWGYDHQSVCHGEGEYARDDDGDGSCEVHVNTMEGFWSLLRSWLRPHRGISQEKLPIFLGFFESLHNVRARGKGVLGTLIGLLVTPPCNPS